MKHSLVFRAAVVDCRVIRRAARTQPAAARITVEA